MDRPVGALLLLWPTWWALWLAAQDFPPIGTLVIFTVGVWLMRSAGCVINDFADRKLDPEVQRTRDRPLAAGTVSTREAIGRVRHADRARVPAGSADQQTDDRAVADRRVPRDHLSVHEAVHLSAAGLSRLRVRLVDPDGVRGGEGRRLETVRRGAAAVRPAVPRQRDFLDGVRHRIRDGRSRRRSARRREIHRHPFRRCRRADHRRADGHVPRRDAARRATRASALAVLRRLRRRRGVVRVSALDDPHARSRCVFRRVPQQQLGRAGDLGRHRSVSTR